MISIQTLLFLSFIALIVGVWVLAVNRYNHYTEIDNWYDSHHAISSMVRKVDLPVNTSVLKEMILTLTSEMLTIHPNLTVICSGFYLSHDNRYVVTVLGFEGEVDKDDICWLDKQVVSDILKKAHGFVNSNSNYAPKFLFTDVMTSHTNPHKYTF